MLHERRRRCLSSQHECRHERIDLRDDEHIGRRGRTPHAAVPEEPCELRHGHGQEELVAGEAPHPHTWAVRARAYSGDSRVIGAFLARIAAPEAPRRHWSRLRDPGERRNRARKGRARRPREALRPLARSRLDDRRQVPASNKRVRPLRKCSSVHHGREEPVRRRRPHAG